MDLVEIVALDFLLEDATYVFQGGEPFESTSSHDPILEPAIRSFDFCLWLEAKGRRSHPHPASAGLDATEDRRHPFPGPACARRCPGLDEAEDAQIIHVVLQRQSIVCIRLCAARIWAQEVSWVTKISI